MRAQTHDPFRHAEPVRVPRLAREPWQGPVVVLAHVDRYPPFVNAGAEWMLHAMLRHLVEVEGMEVHVTTGVHEPADVDGVQVWPANQALSLASGADVLVGHLLWTREVITLAHRARLPLLYLAHNDFQVRYWKIGPGDVTAVVQNAEWVARRHVEQFPNWTQDQIVVRPPCRMRDYHLRRDPDASLITLVNPNADKGSGLFYEVARRLPARRFLVVGGAYGKQDHPPKEVANVAYQAPTGAIAQDVYRRTRLLMVPSRYESWGRVAVEAMCSGIPVLAHPTPGLVEACDRGTVFCDRDDPAAWVDAIEALDDPKVYADRSSHALQRAILLDVQADRDLVEWARLVRRAAATSVASRQTTATPEDPMGHDPFRAQTDSLTGQPATAPAPLTGDAGGDAVRVPSGNVAAVTDWIDNGRSAAQREQRARAAIDAEGSRAKPRKGVIAHAEAVLQPATV